MSIFLKHRGDGVPPQSKSNPAPTKFGFIGTNLHPRPRSKYVTTLDKSRSPGCQRDRSSVREASEDLFQRGFFGRFSARHRFFSQIVGSKK